jgi:carbon-monoxide dehydrogenase medium subunit
MKEFAYVAPEKLQEAAKLLATHEKKALMMAGGTDLLVFMRAGQKKPDLVIDSKKIPELNQLHLDTSGLTIGAAVSCRDIWANDKLAERFPALIDCTSLIGGIQIQGRATIGGNLCNAAPSADTIPTLIAYRAVAHVVSVRGSRDVPVEEICTAPGQTSLSDDEILVKLSIPNPAPNSGAKFLRFIPRNEMDIAVANVAAAVELDRSGTRFRAARIAIGAVAPTPLFVKASGDSLLGQPVDDETIAAAAVIAREAASPIDDMRGTIEHRTQLVEVLTRRVLHAAVKRARGDTA